MIKIEQEAWDLMVAHAQKTYPNECCGAMLGPIDGDAKTVRVALPLENAYPGAQAFRDAVEPKQRRVPD